ncbi:hypothetical protein [Lapidilactobacillus wuchangensis]|uniref:hypothetical protein n=1 Tax=Lapidilactobacillus wuchangensis TaxID=2486001 RepID=UPI0013DE154B|nr:hypothetical protein [Lapidilactobacillus wuchangensis]
MEGVVVSRQICLAALAVRQRLVFETIVVFNWFKSMPAAFHNQQTRNGVRLNPISTPSSSFNGFKFWSLIGSNRCSTT